MLGIKDLELPEDILTHAVVQLSVSPIVLVSTTSAATTGARSSRSLEVHVVGGVSDYTLSYGTAPNGLKVGTVAGSVTLVSPS